MQCVPAAQQQQLLTRQLPYNAGGNSGGPAFNHRGECVGIAFQSLKDGDTENIGENLTL